MRILASLGLLALLAGCGSNPTGNDMSMNDLSMSSDMAGSGGDMACPGVCGCPGDTGNSKGVGKFCTTGMDCGMGMACSALFHPGTNFCTLTTTCNPPVDTATCGENTVCQCDPNLGGACGCTPAACAATPQG